MVKKITNFINSVDDLMVKKITNFINSVDDLMLKKIALYCNGSDAEMRCYTPSSYQLIFVNWSNK